MAPPPFAEGTFVWCAFPFGPPGHDPTAPGPSPHIAYVLGHRLLPQMVVMMLAYTSSGPWRGVGARPVGVLDFPAAMARPLHQRAFHLDLRCLARVSLSDAWFPRLGQPDRGIVAVADRATRDRINAEAARLARSPNLEIRGIQV